MHRVQISKEKQEASNYFVGDRTGSHVRSKIDDWLDGCGIHATRLVVKGQRAVRSTGWNGFSINTETFVEGWAYHFDQADHAMLFKLTWGGK